MLVLKAVRAQLLLANCTCIEVCTSALGKHIAILFIPTTFDWVVDSHIWIVARCSIDRPSSLDIHPKKLWLEEFSLRPKSSVRTTTFGQSQHHCPHLIHLSTADRKFVATSFNLSDVWNGLSTILANCSIRYGTLCINMRQDHPCTWMKKYYLMLWICGIGPWPRLHVVLWRYCSASHGCTDPSFPVWILRSTRSPYMPLTPMSSGKCSTMILLHKNDNICIQVVIVRLKFLPISWNICRTRYRSCHRVPIPRFCIVPPVIVSARFLGRIHCQNMNGNSYLVQSYQEVSVSVFHRQYTMK